MVRKIIVDEAEKLGLDKYLTYLYVNLRYSYSKKLFDSHLLNYPSVKNENNELILFPIICGCRYSEVVAKAFISHALNLRGYNTKFILCDREIPICTDQTIKGGPKCNYCYYIAKKLSSKLCLDTSWIGDFIVDEDKREANDIISSTSFDEYFNFDYKGVNIGLYAEAATKRYLQKGCIEKKDLDMKIFSEYLVSSIILTDLSEKMLKEINPTRIITSNIAYLSGVLEEYFSNNGIKCIACDFGLFNSTLNLNYLNKEKITLYHTSTSFWRRYSSKKLTEKKKNKLNEVINSRIKGQNLIVNYGKFSKSINKDEIFDSLDVTESEKLGVLFSNLVWDASLAGMNSVFKDQFQWIRETINWHIINENRSLIIKVHPSEEIIGTNQSILSFINSEFPSLPPNIKILSPKSEINTYDLFKVVDYGIVYTSTAGLEMAMNGIPTIVNAETHYRGKGFTFDVNSLKDYFDLLNRNIQMTKQMCELAQIYGYLHFYDKQIPFPFIEFSGENFSQVQINLNDWTDLLPNSNKYLDIICDGIVEEKEFLRSDIDEQQ